MQGEKGVILITGSSGFIGAAAARRRARDYSVVGLDREGNPHPPPEAECVCVDLRHDASVCLVVHCLRTARFRTPLACNSAQRARSVALKGTSAPRRDCGPHIALYRTAYSLIADADDEALAKYCKDQPLTHANGVAGHDRCRSI